MVKILMVNIPLAGHTNPTLPLAEALVGNGHSVSYVNAEEYRTKIENTGAEFIPFVNYPDSPTNSQKARMMFRAAYDTAIGLRQKFDLVIYEMFFHPGIKIADRLGVPAVRQFAQPAWPKDTMAKASAYFKLTCCLVDYQVMRPRDKAHMNLGGKTMAEAIVHDKPALNIVYVPRIFQTRVEEFGGDYLFAMPANGTLGFDPPDDQVIPYEEMASPIVYISLGSLFNKRSFYKECIRAFGDRNVSVILNTARTRVETLGRIPKNVYAYQFVPQIDVLQHCDVFLTHCGMNSVNEAMAYGVPMVAMPFAGDQLSNAKRIVELGIGKQMRSFPSSGKQAFEAVMDVCNDAQIRQRSAEIQGMLRQEASLEEAVDRIEQLL
ncbi:MAG: hypothetical protein FWF71_06000 [Actinomycetia bacterium]|nr:hypothetical protein [Actinomycetes bacterium]